MFFLCHLLQHIVAVSMISVTSKLILHAEVLAAETCANIFKPARIYPICLVNKRADLFQSSGLPNVPIFQYTSQQGKRVFPAEPNVVWLRNRITSIRSVI